MGKPGMGKPGKGKSLGKKSQRRPSTAGYGDRKRGPKPKNRAGGGQVSPGGYSACSLYGSQPGGSPPSLNGPRKRCLAATGVNTPVLYYRSLCVHAADSDDDVSSF